MKYYKCNSAGKLDDKLFFDPSCEYRGAPFWAWNSRLDPKELCEQIDIFKEMGLGGFNMHVRQGLETPYLGTDFMDAVKACCEKAEKEKVEKPKKAKEEKAKPEKAPKEEKVKKEKAPKEEKVKEEKAKKEKEPKKSKEKKNKE